MMRRLLVALLISSAAQAQDSAFALLRIDGNGIAAMRTVITISFDGPTAGEAFATVAQQAQLNITLDPSLSGMNRRMSITPHERTAAVALLEIAQASRLRVRVSPDGQVIVDGAYDPKQRLPSDIETNPMRLPLVSVRAERESKRQFTSEVNLGGVSITAQELAASPTFIEPDLLRSIQTLPGIAARSDYAAGFNSRGGEADQNMIMLDGYPIYSPFHLAGVFSTFIDPTVGRVALHTGALPVQYGGRLSSVMDVRSAENVNPKTSDHVDVSMVSSVVSFSRLFGDGGSWTLAGRRTYADVVANMLKPNSFPYHFGDVQGHIALPVGHGMRLAITGYSGRDVTEGTVDDFRSGRWGNDVIGATLSRTIDEPSLGRWSLGDSLSLEQRVSFTGFDARLNVGDLNLSVNNHVRDVRVGGSATAYRGRTESTFGYEFAAQRLIYEGNAISSAFEDLFPFDSASQRLHVASLYAQRAWRPWKSMLVEGGARMDALFPRNWLGVSPRVAVKQFVGANTAFSIGAGQYSQWIHSLGHEEEPVQPVQFWVASDKSLPVSRSRDLTLGVEHWVTPLRFVHIAAWRKRYDHVMLVNTASAPDTPGDEFFASKGTSRGVDLLVRQLDGGMFSGWLAYTYALSARELPTGARFAPTQDRRHNLNLVGSWVRGAWHLGLRANVATGMPHTPMIGAFGRQRYDAGTHTWVTDRDGQNITGPYNSERLPWYFRLDFSATRDISIGNSMLSPYFSIVNALNTKNPASYFYTFEDGGDRRGSFPNLPFVPTLGFRLAF
jgi:hypothetical protein